MIDDLKKAIEKIEALSPEDQKRFADLIVDELAWSESLRKSTTKLNGLANEALEEYRSGKTKPLDF